MIFIFSKLLLHSTRNFYIEQFVKFVFSHMRYIFNNLRFVFHKMKFIKLKSYTFSKPNLYVISYTSNRIWQNEISVLWAVHPVCKYFLTLFERWCFEVEFSFFTILLFNELMPRIGIGVGAWSHPCGCLQDFVWIWPWLVHISLAEACSRMCYWSFFYWSYKCCFLS